MKITNITMKNHLFKRVVFSFFNIIVKSIYLNNDHF
ncbi:hypothetical protein RAYM_02037 [Riemerella anatipestifer RA-YM]|nr:hypothetical protein RAYM_02037 [Riemerella anatipestifer RA-YM]SNV57903.1 Uncharacterised protein [Riemerella anatipestifer]